MVQTLKRRTRLESSLSYPTPHLCCLYLLDRTPGMVPPSSHSPQHSPCKRLSPKTLVDVGHAEMRGRVSAGSSETCSSRFPPAFMAPVGLLQCDCRDRSLVRSSAALLTAWSVSRLAQPCCRLGTHHVPLLLPQLLLRPKPLTGAGGAAAECLCLPCCF